MKHQNGVTLPQKYLVTFADEVFGPLKNGECVSCMFAAGGGKRTILHFLLSEENILKKVFGDLYKKTLFIYIDPNEILNVSTEAYLALILHCMTRTMKEHKIEVLPEISGNPLEIIKKNLENLIVKDLHAVFILNDFEFTTSLPPSIYLNLESIMSVDKSKIVYLFLSTINLFDEKILGNLHNLKYAVSRKVRYFPLFKEAEANYLIDQTCKKLKFKASNMIKSILYEICGGHPQLLKYSLHLIHEEFKLGLNDDDKIRIFLLNHYQLKIICADIWNFFTDKEKNTTNSIVTTGAILSSQQEEIDYLLKLGLVKIMKEKKYYVFGTLFEEFVKNKLPKHTLTYNAETTKLYYGQTSCEDKFTYQEFKLLVYFVTHENELISRDQVADAIWGRLSHEKYSDWSIDKTISVLRKKLDVLGFPSEQLVTLKKRGFSFSNPS